MDCSIQLKIANCSHVINPRLDCSIQWKLPDYVSSFFLFFSLLSRNKVSPSTHYFNYISSNYIYYFYSVSSSSDPLGPCFLHLVQLCPRSLPRTICKYPPTILCNVSHTLSRLECPQCGENFPSANARKNHVRSVHVTEIQIKGFPPIPCVDGYFHCPKCTHKGRNAHSFYRHPHILEMRGMGAKQPTTAMPSHVATRESTVPILPQPSPRSPTPAPLLPEPEEVDDLGDEDYQPMDVDPDQLVYGSRSDELIRPVGLQSLQIGIDPWHHCIVCEGCQCGIPRPSLHNHIMQSHGGPSKVPPNLQSILDEYQVPVEIHPPTSKVIPVSSLPIVPGFMCSVPGCGTASVVEASLARTHGQVVHRDILAQDRIVPSLVQVIFPSQQQHQVWPVDPNYASLNHNTDYASALDKIKEHDAQGWDDGRIHTPRDPRHLNGFLKQFGWLQITEGKDYKELCSLVATPTEDCPALLPLKDKLEGYFTRIQPIVEGMAPLVLRWINTPEG